MNEKKPDPVSFRETNLKKESRKQNLFSFFDRFRRITYSTDYIPQIDGLRFLAIFSVVVIMHIPNYINDKFYKDELIPDGYWKEFIFGGGVGVPLFFVISGFILSVPFARWRLQGGTKVSLRNYYLRRLTRLEPPYLVALLLLFIAHVWILRSFTFLYLFPHLLASSVYLHTVYYHSISPVMPVAWSLEVEVQFYVLAPLFFMIFLISSRWLRRLICLAIIIAGTVYWYDTWGVGHVFMYLHCFFMGILCADLYCSGKQLFPNQYLGAVIGLLSLACFLFFHDRVNVISYYIKISCLFFLTYTVLTNIYMKRLFSVKGLILIGGMCYSIYLLHFAIISFAGSLLPGYEALPGNPYYFIPLLLLLSLTVLVISAIFFLTVEKPFMRPRGLRKDRPDV